MGRSLLSLAGALLIQSLAIGAAFGETAPALVGHVSSNEEGAMEGVVVSAKRDGATITISVVTDQQGHYAFPATTLTPGHYALSIRAIGYELTGPDVADIVPERTTTADLKLVKTKDLASQLNSGEWLLSLPGTETQKKGLLNCNDCHSLPHIPASSHTAEEFVAIFDRMAGYSAVATPMMPQRMVNGAKRNVLYGADPREYGEFLASINLSKGSDWSYPLKTLPRVKGRSTRVVITEYDLPRPEIQPHDVIVDDEGIAWYSDFGEQFLGRLDPKTGEVTEFPIPVLRPGFPTGTLDLESDKEGNLWIALMYNAAVAKFDRKTRTMQTFQIPKEWQGDATLQAFLSPASSHVDGKIWVKNSDGAKMYRWEPATGKWEDFGTFNDAATGKRIAAYGIPVDSQNNVYLLDFAISNAVGRLDAKTGAFSVHHTPTANSRPRRGRFDAQDRLWFAEYAGNAIGMLDPNTGEFKEWVAPTPWSNPYDVVADKNGEVWTGGMNTDRVLRLDPRTSVFTEYPLPRETNIRRVFVDNATTPVTMWVGSNHGASIVKIEPLD
jgi:virginiamycin B lyase